MSLYYRPFQALRPGQPLAFCKTPVNLLSLEIIVSKIEVQLKPSYRTIVQLSYTLRVANILEDQKDNFMVEPRH